MCHTCQWLISLSLVCTEDTGTEDTGGASAISGMVGWGPGAVGSGASGLRWWSGGGPASIDGGPTVIGGGALMCLVLGKI